MSMLPILHLRTPRDEPVKHVHPHLNILISLKLAIVYSNKPMRHKVYCYLQKRSEMRLTGTLLDKLEMDMVMTTKDFKEILVVDVG